MDRVMDRVRETIQRYGLLTPGDRVVVGVSGGPDSLCLLHLLCCLSVRYRLALHVAHLHHGLRGADADADARFVRDLAADWALPCTVERVNVPALARQHRLAVEEAARRARYDFLGRVAEAINASKIAVGHNADDQAETVLMHFVRGSGMAGLRGMLPLTPLSDYRLLGIQNSASKISNLKLIRPLLEISRADIEAYCAFYELQPRFDLSNLDTTCFRNWLRHQVIPLLEQHNPNLRQVLCRSARVMADDYALLRSLLEETWPRVVREETAQRILFDLAAWRALPPGLQRSTLREAIHRLRLSLRNINFLHVENARSVAADGTTGDQATLPQGLMLTVGYDHFTVAEAGAGESPPDWPLLLPEGAPLPVAVPGLTLLPGSDWALQAELLAPADLPGDWQANTDPWRAFLDAEGVGERLWLRTRRPGDRFQPQGLGGHTVKLGDLMTNQKVPRPARNRLPLLESERGIVWVCGLRVDECACVRGDTQRVLALRFVLTGAD